MMHTESPFGFTAACIQMNASVDWDQNLQKVSLFISEAAARGAKYVQTPEMTTIMQNDKTALFISATPDKIQHTLEFFSKLALDHKLWLHIGSIPVPIKDKEQNSRFFNRSYVFAPSGEIIATYDKIHMFDVNLHHHERYRESETYRPGKQGVMLDLTFLNHSSYVKPYVRLGLSICYDVRFASLFRAYAERGAILLGAPAAFTQQTGCAHWHVLQRARAIETGSFMISAAQVGCHDDGRETYGHSIIIDPWGQILAEADGKNEMVITADIIPALAYKVREQIPVLAKKPKFDIIKANSVTGR